VMQTTNTEMPTMLIGTFLPLLLWCHSVALAILYF
jgi:hypothetical protein